MGIQINADSAQSRLCEAIEWAADESRPVDAHWTKLTAEFADTKHSKTVTAFLATALLATAIDEDVDRSIRVWDKFLRCCKPRRLFVR